MKEQLLLLGKYNQYADNQVIRILEKLDESERSKDRKSFAVSLHGLLDHIFESTLFFHKQLRNTFLELDYLNHKFIGFDTVYKKINLPDFNELKTAVDLIDKEFVDFLGYISEEELNKAVQVNSFIGVEKLSVWFVILQCINHATHHRGEISQILDEMGIENDYSGIRQNYDNAPESPGTITVTDAQVVSDDGN